METTHRIYYQSAAFMRPLPDESAALVVTSPPYPMIATWNRHYGFAVKTARETDLWIDPVLEVRSDGENRYRVRCERPPAGPWNGQQTGGAGQEPAEAPFRGMKNEKVAPFPGWLSAQMRPL